VSERIDLPVSWSCLLRSSVLVLVCTYSRISATDESTSGSHFFNSPHLCRRVGFHLFNVIESANFHCFLHLREQEEVAWCKVRGAGRVWEGRNVVFSQKFICGDSPVSRSIVMMQDRIARTPLVRAMSAHSIAEALQDCFVEFLIYRLASGDILMMNKPFNVEECNQHGLDIGLHLPCFLRSRRWCSFPLGRRLLCFRVIPINPAFVTSDSKDMKFRSFWARLRRSVQIDTRSSFCSAVRRRDTNFADTRLICKSSVRIFWHVPNAIPTSSATSLIVRRWLAQMISHTRATVSSVWGVDGLPGRGSSSKDQCPFLKREYDSNAFDRLRQDSPIAACRLPQSECGEVPASSYASTLAQSYHLSCLVATSLRIIASPKKKSVPELNDQPT